MFRHTENVRLAHCVTFWLTLQLALISSASLALCCSLRLLLALSLSFSGFLWLSVTPTLALTGSHCHSWHTLALSGSLLLSNFAYTVLDRLSGPLLGSHRRCHADAFSPALCLSNKNENYERHRDISAGTRGRRKRNGRVQSSNH